ncbi:MAG: M28 family peptidase [Gemmatimonadota bacterium]
MPLLALLLVATLPLSAQTVWPDEGVRTWAPRPTESAITANDLRTRLYQLADDSMMGRQVGTRGGVMATDYIAAEFKRIGLVPAGENGSYFQDVHYAHHGYDKAVSTVAVSGKALVAGADWAPMPPSAAGRLSGNADLKAVPTVFGGRFGDSTTVLTSAMVRGKVVIFTEPTMTEMRTNLGTRQVQAPGNYTMAQDAGAAGVFVIGIPAEAAFRARTSIPTHTDGATTVGATVTLQAAEQILGAPVSGMAIGTVGKPVTGRWSYAETPLEYPTRNVIGMLPGSDPSLKGEYVVLGAHNDHVGMVRADIRPEHDSLRGFNTVLRPQGANDRVALDAVTPAEWSEINALIKHARSIRPARIDSVNNGADDDGSGTAVLLEIAERMAKGERPKRSILFNSHAGEEAGLLGSSYFVDHPTIPLDSVSAALNMDMLGKGRVTDVKFGGPNSVQMLGSRRLSAEYGDLIDSLNAVRDEPMAIDYSWDRTNALNRFCRSDQVNYIRKGIPTTYFSLGYARDYHQPTDEPQYIDYDHGARLGRFVHDIALTIANRPTKLAILPVAEQDKSASCGR